MFAVRTSILKELFADPEWRSKWDQCMTTAEMEKVTEDFCKAKGYRVASPVCPSPSETIANTFLGFLDLCKDAQDLIVQLKKKPEGIKLQRMKPSTLRVSALHYLARKRGLGLTLNHLYHIYGKYQSTITKTEKIIKELDEGNSNAERL